MSPERPSVRSVQVDDIEQVAEIYAHYVRSTVATFDEVPPTVEVWRRRVDDLGTAGLPFLVADADGAIAGYAYASAYRPKPAYRHTVEDSIYLSPTWTGKGIGRLLLAALLARCAEAGARQVVAVVADSGDPASVALHRAFGFEEAGRLKAVGYKHDRWIDTLLLQRDLNDPAAGHERAG
ncbi:GNAT family N-acetyltransferase [Actinopolymorpha alba]|uniref:GNAT family N-acetyltransferase n=1 Tax=Actinopolymorpha alba TaxID=533267 RepID=UPI000363A18F|nr:GNAT family N-acetyltransferase [Actinopolymorpha alba]